MEDSASASNPNQLQLGQRTEKNIGRQTLKGTVYILFMEGPRNRLQLTNTVYFKRFYSSDPYGHYGQFYGVTDRSKMVHQQQ